MASKVPGNRHGLGECDASVMVLGAANTGDLYDTKRARSPWFARLLEIGCVFASSFLKNFVPKVELDRTYYRVLDEIKSYYGGDFVRRLNR